MTTELHIPQQVPYRMVGVLVDCNKHGATTEYWVGAVTPYMQDGKLTPAGILENMVQSCYAWWKETRPNEELKVLAVDGLSVAGWPKYGDSVFTRIEVDLDAEGSICLCATSFVQKKQMAAAQLTFAVAKTDYNGTAIVIGGGLSGLFTAAMLVKRGLKVTVLEQNKQVGGGLLCFYKNDLWWDAGIHCVQGLQKGSWCYDLLKELGIHIDVEQTSPFVIHGGENIGEREREFLYPVRGDVRQQIYRQQTFGYGDQRLVGGCRSLLEQLVACIKEHGGRIITRADVCRVKVGDDGFVHAVETLDGSSYEAEVVVSSIHVKSLMATCKVPLFKEATMRRIKETKESPGSIGVYVKLKPATLPYMREFHYVLPEDIAVYSPCNEKHQKWTSSVILYQWVDYEELKPWYEKRDEKYEEWKEARAQKILNRVYECMPELKDSIESYFVATSLTFRDEFHSPEGALYGISDKLQTIYTKVPNLILTGQSCYPHGFANMLAISVRTRDAVLEYLDMQK